MFSIKHIAKLIDATIVGDADFEVKNLKSLENADHDSLSFISNRNYQHLLASTQAGAVIMSSDLQEHFCGTKLIVNNPYLAYAQISALFYKNDFKTNYIHANAVIGNNVVIGDNVTIEAFVVIGNNAVIGNNTIIKSSVTIENNVVIGDSCYINPQVVLYQNTFIGDNVIIHSGSVIGSDGFGYVPKPDKSWQKIYQIGRVVIGNNVEIGANCAIDRGALSDTVIGEDVKIDNLVHIAHNVIVGNNTAIAACVGIAGSTTIGNNCTIAGKASITGHINIVDNVHIQGAAMITSSIKESGVYASGTGYQPVNEWRKTVVHIRQIEKLAKKIKLFQKFLEQKYNIDL